MLLQRHCTCPLQETLRLVFWVLCVCKAHVSLSQAMFFTPEAVTVCVRLHPSLLFLVQLTRRVKIMKHNLSAGLLRVSTMGAREEQEKG